MPKGMQSTSMDNASTSMDNVKSFEHRDACSDPPKHGALATNVADVSIKDREAADEMKGGAGHSKDAEPLAALNGDSVVRKDAEKVDSASSNAVEGQNVDSKGEADENDESVMGRKILIKAVVDSADSFKAPKNDEKGSVQEIENDIPDLRGTKSATIKQPKAKQGKTSTVTIVPKGRDELDASNTLHNEETERLNGGEGRSHFGLPAAFVATSTKILFFFTMLYLSFVGLQYLTAPFLEELNLLMVSQSVCVSSSQRINIAWMKMLAERSDVRMHDLTPILQENADFSLVDKLKPLLGCRLYLVESVDRFKSRNPLEKYEKIRPYLSRLETTILLVNGTCEDFIELLTDGRTGREAECNFMRQRTFEEFKSVHVNHIVSGARVVDVPPQKSKSLYAKRAFNRLNLDKTSQAHVTFDSRSQTATADLEESDGGQRFHSQASILKRMVLGKPSTICETKNLEGIFPRFQFAVVGLEGAGKSTTLYWLANHLGLSEETKNSFASGKTGASFTRHLNALKLGPVISAAVISDTMGLPALDQDYLCDIKKLMEGRFVPNSAMKWTGSCPSFYTELPFIRAPVSIPDARNAMHSLLFVIRNTKEARNELRAFVKAMKMGTKSDGLDLTQRMVFAATKAADVKSLANDIGVSELDIFALNDLKTLDQSPVFVPPNLYVPIIKRLMEKACRYYSTQAPEEIESGWLVSFFKMSGGSFWYVAGKIVFHCWVGVIWFYVLFFVSDVLQLMPAAFLRNASSIQTDVLLMAVAVLLSSVTFPSWDCYGVDAKLAGMFLLHSMVLNIYWLSMVCMFTKVMQTGWSAVMHFAWPLVPLLLFFLPLFLRTLCNLTATSSIPALLCVASVHLASNIGRDTSPGQQVRNQYERTCKAFLTLLLQHFRLLVTEALCCVVLRPRAANFAETKRHIIEFAANMLIGAVVEGWTGLPGLRLVDVSRQPKTMLALQALLAGTHVGAGGRDLARTAPYTRLEIVGGWRVENTDLWQSFALARRKVLALRRYITQVWIRPELHRAGASLPGQPLERAANEVRLLHGTSASALGGLLNSGLNERLAGSGAGTVFGEGVYLADDAGKADHYARPDAAYSADTALRGRLYGGTRPHAGELCYMLVVRAVLGSVIKTKDGVTATAPVQGAPVFATPLRRELSPIADASPQVPHHFLVVERAPGHERFTEYVGFHSEQLYPEYLIAYQHAADPPTG